MRGLRILMAVALSPVVVAMQLPRVAVASERSDIQAVVSQIVRPLMVANGIPGMAVGVTTGGRHYVFTYGVASKTTGKPVEPTTLFEIGSITKTFTATLASYAQVTGKLSFSDMVSADYPALRGTAFDRVRLINLGTHTSGGLPLQFPDEVQTDADALTFYRGWTPTHPAGTYRLYANTSIMLLGLIAAHRFGADFVPLMQRTVFAPLGMKHTYLAVPQDQMRRYAQGYTSVGKPRRMASGPLAAEAYGVRTTASDMLRFLDANMNELPLDATLRRAIGNTHTGYYRLGAMTQDLIWEHYRYPVTLTTLLQGNSDDVLFDANVVSVIDPPSPPRDDVLINKTGSTSGFAAYVAFMPKRKIGVVLLANRAYSIRDRVTAAYRLLACLKART